jgi:SOS-response transcriptional repressor LexA
MMGLTPQQARALDAIRRLTRDDISPSFRQVGRAIGVSSSHSAHRLLHGLRERILGELDQIEHRSTPDLRALRDRIDAILKVRSQ